MSRHPGNWVDRREPPEDKLARCLAGIFGLDPDHTDERIAEEARVILHMVAANASEVELASYLGAIEERLGFLAPAGRGKRTAAVALWHVAKAGLVHNQLVSIIEQYGPRPTSETVRLADWLAERIRDVAATPPAEDAASRLLSTFLGNWRGAARAGCATSGLVSGTLESITFRIETGDGPHQALSLRAALRDGVPVIELYASALAGEGPEAPGFRHLTQE